VENIICNILKNERKITIDIYDLEKKTKEILGNDRPSFFYKDFADVILSFEEEMKIERVKSSKPYSRDLRIQTKYKKAKVTDNQEAERKNEILTHFHIQMRMGSYLQNLIQYEEDKPELSAISQFLGAKSDKECYLSVNERSYELFGNEKFLSSSKGKKLLVTIALTYDDLCCFETYEPFFHYDVVTSPDDHILVIENKDTFFSLKKLFLEGRKTWFGVTFGMLIYGEGNKITKSIDYLEELQIPVETPIFYFGDFDPEGLAILHRIQEKTERIISIWKPMYLELWKRRKGSKIVKEQKWNEAAIQASLQSFEPSLQKEMESYLKKQQYIPQEAVHINLLRSMSDGTN
jgi:hypothetical protein